MKKTLIALAVVASAAGSAMANDTGWVASGTSGTFSMGGTLTAKELVTPWEARVYADVMDLNADIAQDSNKVDMTFQNNIPVVAIRNSDKNGFQGGANVIKPSISFGEGVLGEFSAGAVAPLTLKITDATSAKELGTVTAQMRAGALSAWSTTAGIGWRSLKADVTTAAFWGGLPKTDDLVMTAPAVEAFMKSMDADVVNKLPATRINYSPEVYGEGYCDDRSYWGVYVAGFKMGDKITINLKEASKNDSQIKWKAELPIQIAYN